MGDEALYSPESDGSHIDHEGNHPEYQQQELPENASTISVDGTTIGVVAGWDYDVTPNPGITAGPTVLTSNPSGEMPLAYFNPTIPDPIIAFHVDDGVEIPILSVTKDGFFVKGEQISEGSSVYKAFCEWLQISRHQNGLPNNFQSDPIKEKPVIPLLSRYDLLKNPKHFYNSRFQSPATSS